MRAADRACGCALLRPLDRQSPKGWKAQRGNERDSHAGLRRRDARLSVVTSKQTTQQPECACSLDHPSATMATTMGASREPAVVRQRMRSGGQALHAQDQAIIRAEDLTKVYPGTDFVAVDRLDLRIQAGEIFGLLGPNGAGKTTTAGMLTTRIVPTAGTAHLGAVDIITEPSCAKQLIGIVSQQNTLDRQLTVW